MQEERWRRVESAFLQAADLPPGERSLFLDSTCDGDADLRAEIESLIASDSGDDDCINSVVRDEAALVLDAQSLDGQRLGPYRVLREIGRGGMGTVYLAVRDDDQFQKQVAVKVVKRGMDSAEVLARFRHERQILANLDHPYIARLLDAGTTPDGRPFFILEYVDGQTIDVYCQQQRLSPAACCRLFLRVCEAVSYAHRNLVVHRDLKPANILVGPDHAPKLLDFGVAKLLSSDSNGGTTALFHRPFTPDYASPELIRGLPVTTATDVYALGAVLFEMLTGRRAQSITATTPIEMERAVSEIEIPRASSVTKGINTDLDNIIQMAMRKDPTRRYPSVDLFAEDLRRYLDGKPITARQDSLAYRVGKFLRRNWLEVAAATAVVLSLVVGLAISVNQSRRANEATATAVSERLVAEHERSRAEQQSQQAIAARESETAQRAIADQQRVRAEQRVTQLLELANRSLFDIHDSIKTLSGAMPARRSIVKSTLDYLQVLERDGSMDSRLRLVLSAAYYRLAGIQGDTFGPSLNDFAGARASLLRAESILRPLYMQDKNAPDIMFRWIEIQSSLAENTHLTGARAAAEAAYLAILPVAHRLSQVRPNDRDAVSLEAHIEGRLVSIVDADALAAGRLHADRQVEIIRSLVAQYPSDNRLKQSYGEGLAMRAGNLMRSAQLEAAAASYREAYQIREELLAADPANATLKRGLLVNYGNYATVLGMSWSPNLGRFAEARAFCQKAVVLARQLVRGDSQDANARFDLAMTLSRLGMVDPDPGGVPESLASLDEAIALLEPASRANPKSSTMAIQLSMTREYAGHRLLALGQIAAAERQYRQGLADVEAPIATARLSNVVQAFTHEEALAALFALKGDRASALDFANRAVTRATALYNIDPKSEPRIGHLGRAYAELAAVDRAFHEAAASRAASQRALEIWSTVKDRPAMFLHRQSYESTFAFLSAQLSQ